MAEFLRAHDMPELIAEDEPLRLLLALESPDEGRALADRIRNIQPEVRIDVTEGVIETLARLFDAPPDALLVEATLPGIDVLVLCRELARYPASARVRLIVVRPQTMSNLDGQLRDAGVWSLIDTPARAESIAESLSLADASQVRPKAS